MKILNVLVRRCIPIVDFESAVVFHEKLIKQKARLRFDYPEYGLKLAQVASILFIGGSDESLAAFIATHATFMVDDIFAYEAHLPTIGASILETPKKVPTGLNMLVKHPDGTLIEYVEHINKHPADVLSELH